MNTQETTETVEYDPTCKSCGGEEYDCYYGNPKQPHCQSTSKTEIMENYKDLYIKEVSINRNLKAELEYVLARFGEVTLEKQVLLIKLEKQKKEVISEREVLPQQSENQKQIFTGEGKKICNHCEKSYVYKIHNQKFCSDKCRVDNWKEKTGKTFKYGK